MNDYRPNVEKGAAFLDERMPGWVDRVNVARLDLSSCVACVLGQLGGDYRHEARRLGMNLDDAIQCGFNVSEFENYRVEAQAYSALTLEWQAYIAESRQGVGS